MTKNVCTKIHEFSKRNELKEGFKAFKGFQLPQIVSDLRVQIQVI